MGTEITALRLRLRPLSPADAPRIHNLVGDIAVARWLARVPHPYPAGEAERFVAGCLEADDDVWAIERLGEPGLIGIVGIEGAQPSLGYWLGAPFWGEGYASEAVGAAIGHVFRDRHIRTLASGVFEGNAASLRVQEKFGFQVTGRRMVHCRALDRERPHIDTALARPDWQARP
jgi:RimJ/RimL family protein N-acetyltransferase